MKLSEHIIAIDQAFNAQLSSIEDLEQEDTTFRSHTGIRVRRDLPRLRTPSSIPQLVPTYSPLILTTPFHNKECLFKLAAFQATYYNNPTPISPDMVPLVIDTGASITVTPYSTDFITPIRPVQAVKIKGIASRLKVQVYSDVCYQFYNDAGELQKLTLSNCLYVPQCTTRLLFPRQIGSVSGHPGDGFNALSESPILTYEGKPTMIQYNKISLL
jgi:hypothetical protein